MTETQYKTKVRVITSATADITQLEDVANTFIASVEPYGKIVSTQFSEETHGWVFIITYKTL